MIPFEFLPSTIAGMLSVGLAGTFLFADRNSPTTRALALGLMASGLSIALGTPFADRYPNDAVPFWLRFEAFFEAIAGVALASWLLRVARTAQPSPVALAAIRAEMRVAQAFALIYLAIAFAFPSMRLNDLMMSIAEPGVFSRRGFWLLAVPWIVVTLMFVAAGVTLFLQRIDPAERARAIATAAAAPFIVSGLLVPPAYSPLVNVFAILIFLVGAVRHLMMHSEREQFMSRFLSPEVARIVQTQGLASAMHPQTLEITIVCCDLRGFTPYAACHPSDHVIRLLSEYYEAVGIVVAEFHGTIKDYAGDGILILVGAPISSVDHARRGIALALRVRAAASGVARRWCDEKGKLGVGLGVASGPVTVGAIGSSSRLEYTAVGSAVNLASRLCEVAGDGEILVDGLTAKLAGKEGLESRGAIAVKGFTANVPHYLLVC